MRPHRMVQMALAKRLLDVSAHVDVERYIPELYDQVWHAKRQRWSQRLAIMDLHVSFAGAPSPYWIDVSVRSAAAERAVLRAAPGWAALQGEEEKCVRYKGGTRACVFEALGRPGCAARALLRDLVAIAAACKLCTPHAAQAWQTALERAAIWGCADNVLRSLGGQEAERWSR